MIIFAAETRHEHFVHFEDYDDVPMTCSSENQGQLTYRKDEGNLEMCEGLKWMRLATSKQLKGNKLQYIVAFLPRYNVIQL